MLQLNKNRSTQSCIGFIKREWRKSIAILLAFALSFAIIANIQSFGDKTNDIGRTLRAIGDQQQGDKAGGKKPDEKDESGCQVFAVHVYFHGLKKDRDGFAESGWRIWKVTGQSTVTYADPVYADWQARFIVSYPPKMPLPHVQSWIKPEFMFRYDGNESISDEISKQDIANYIIDFKKQFIAKNEAQFGGKVRIMAQEITPQEEMKRYCVRAMEPYYRHRAGGDPQLQSSRPLPQYGQDLQDERDLGKDEQ